MCVSEVLELYLFDKHRGGVDAPGQHGTRIRLANIRNHAAGPPPLDEEVTTGRPAMTTVSRPIEELAPKCQ